MMGSQTSRVDALSISAIRAFWAAIFFVILLFASGENGEIGGMSTWVMVQLVLSAVIGLAIGDTLYVTSIVRLGMNRAFTISVGLFTVFSFALSAALLGEEVGVLTVVGSALVLLGVYVVAYFGRGVETGTGEGGGGAADQGASEVPSGDGGRDSSTPVAGGSGAAVQRPLARKRGRRPFPLSGRRPFVLGVAAVAVAALAWAIATVWLRDAADGSGPISVGALRIPAAGGFLIVVTMSQSRTTLRRRAVPRRSLLVLSLAGLIGTGVGSLLFIFAVQEAGAGKTAVLSGMSPVFGLMLGAVFLGEPITRWVLGGTGLAVSGIVLLA
jgi:drug/metabolite transporter (DMT)-like permease